MFDEEDVRRKKTGGGELRNLEPLSVDELDAYILFLRAEITRVEAEIVRKKAVLGAAESFFK
ncbi:MAG: DUF1192 domain-containing protein [Rhodospirillales bacterium]|nr:DUF1192 domain-containing protein [Rhodospirillales bacterium]MCB9973179.1 DUF1192 domain-containing protein [Rhodospirillales bacterium]MCB9980170.1 DUF1192 domain-containing protein [Rhodospirillales bacterium]